MRAVFAAIIVTAACGPGTRDGGGSATPDGRIAAGADAGGDRDSGSATADAAAVIADAAPVTWSEQFGSYTAGPGETAFPLVSWVANKVTLPAMTVTGIGMINTDPGTGEVLQLALYRDNGPAVAQATSGALPLGTNIVGVEQTTITAGDYWIASATTGGNPDGMILRSFDANSPDHLCFWNTTALPSTMAPTPNPIGCWVNLFVVGTPPGSVQ